MTKSQFRRPLHLAMIAILIAVGWGRHSLGAVRIDGEPRFGLTVESVTSEILGDLGLPADTHGVIVSHVARGSVAEEAGLRFGDIIQEVDRNRITNVREFRNAMQEADTMVMLLVNRKGDHAFVVLEGPREPAR